MRIRSQLIAALSVSAFIVVIAVAGLAWSIGAYRDLVSEQDRAQLASQAAGDLLVLSQEFAFRNEPRAAQQWWRQHAVIVSALNPDARHTMGNAHALGSMREAPVQLASLFSALQDSGGDMEQTLAIKRKLMIADALVTKTQSLANATDQWASRLSVERRLLGRRVAEFFAGLTAAFALIVGLFAYLIFRRVLLPMATLETAVGAVKSGDYSRRTNSLSRDELGDLARQFDAMTASLSARDAEILVATQALEKEVILRTATESRIRLITDNLPILVAYINEDGRYAFANRQYDFMLGLDSVAMVGKKVGDVLGSRNFKLIKPHLDKALSGQTAVFEIRLETEFAQRDVWATYIPDFDPLGTVQGFFVMHEDVSELKQLKADLRALEDRHAQDTAAGAGRLAIGQA